MKTKRGKTKALVFLTLVLIATISAATCPIISSTTSSSLDWLSDFLKNWKTVIAAAGLLASAVIGLAYVGGEGLNLPQIKAWAMAEIGNAVFTFLIAANLVVIIGALDGILADQVNTSPASPFTCNPGETCVVQVAKQYLEELIKLSTNIGRKSFIQASKAITKQMQGYSISCGDMIAFIPCFFMAYSERPNAYMTLDYERYTIEMRIATDIANSLNLQQFVATTIGPIAGAFLMCFGLALRLIAPLRRTGGMLIAVGVALFFVFPALYAWNAMTLNVAVYGDEIVSGKDLNCPVNCTKTPPIGYDTNGNVYYSVKDIHPQIDPNDPNVVALLHGSQQSVTICGKTITSCEYLAKHTSHGYCPKMCRYLPYPFYLGGKISATKSVGCADPEVEKACNELPPECKVKRLDLTKDCTDQCTPDYCKIIAPMKGDTSCNNCADVPPYCRVALRQGAPYPSDGLQWRLRKCVETYYGASLTQSKCHADMDPEKSCMFVVPEPPSKLCRGPWCCIGEGCQVEKQEITVGNDKYAGVAFKCNGHWGPENDPNKPMCKPGTCFTINPAHNPVCKEYSGHTCKEIRMMYPQEIIDNYFPYCNVNPNSPLYYNISAACWDDKIWCKITPSGTCGPTPKCVAKGKDIEEPGDLCSQCMTASQACVFANHTILYCEKSCTKGVSMTDTPRKITPEEFIKTSKSGMVGRQDIMNVASLLLPAYALPVFDILVTIIFIRTFAPLFGGDYYLPGLGKVI